MRLNLIWHHIVNNAVGKVIDLIGIRIACRQTDITRIKLRID